MKEIDNFINKLNSVKKNTLKSSIITHMMDMNDDELRILHSTMIKIKQERNLCQCGATLSYYEGCQKCLNCGYSECEL